MHLYQEFHAQQKLHCMVTQKTSPQVHDKSYIIDIKSITTQGVLAKHVTKLHLYNQEAWTNLTQQFQALTILVMY